MQPFRLSLSDDGFVAGTYSTPPLSESPATHRPLILALHGGTYNHQYFDATPNYSASLSSVSFGVPFIAIDRPSYGGTSSILPIPEGSDFNQETGRRLHHHILPKLWSEIGAPGQCKCIVLLCHSLGVIGGVVAAALHAQGEKPLYPLGGLIASGMGDKLRWKRDVDPHAKDEHSLIPTEAKDAIIFKPGTAPREIFEQSERLNTPSPRAETDQFVGTWLPMWKEKWAAHVMAPVRFSLVEDDCFFLADEQEIDTCVRAFKNSSRVDGSLIRGAPHCMELSCWSQGWYARCFGFVLECAASFAKL